MTIKLKDHNESSPTDEANGVYNKDWQTYYTFDAAVRLFWDRLPTKEQLLEAINSVPWNCEEKAKALNVPFAGWRASDGGFYSAGSFALLWSSSVYDSSSAWCVYLARSNDAAYRNYWDRSYGRSVRLLADKSDSSDSLALSRITKHMQEWQKEYDWKFKTSSIFWEMFYKEMEKVSK